MIRTLCNTNQAALTLGLRPQTLRKRYSQTGTYFGIVPTKLPNGKLRWPVDAIEAMLAQGGAQ